jgi:hypothetical protein
MDLSEGKAALEEMRALERRLDARLKEAKTEAAKIVEDATARANAAVREKESLIESLKPAKTAPKEGAAATPETFKLDEKFADAMARELLDIIKKN